MKTAYGSMQCVKASGGRGIPCLPEPSKKDLSQHPQGKGFKADAQASAPSLDFIERNCNKPHKAVCRFCGAWTVSGPQEAGGRLYVRLGCKKWTCQRCGPKKARRVRNGIIQQAIKKNLTRFLTLTLDPRACSVEDSVKYIRATWRKFRVYLERKHKTSISFIAVVEFQKNGYAHLHVLVDRFIAQQWIAHAWQAVGGGKMVFIKQADIQRVAAYISKYLTKELLLAQGPGKYRRYTTSRNIALFEKVEKGLWQLIKLPIELLYAGAMKRAAAEKWDENQVLLSFCILGGAVS